LGKFAGQHHFDGDSALEAQMPGLVDDAHAAAAQHGLNLMVLDFRQFGYRPHGGTLTARVVGVREQGAQLGFNLSQPLPGGLDLRQEFRAFTANLLGVPAGIQERLEQCVDARIIGHC
jgi:hypothetical protein